MKPTPDDPLYLLWQNFQELNENQLQEMKEFLDRYLAICWRIFERIKDDSVKMAELHAENVKKRKAARSRPVAPKCDSSKGSWQICLTLT